MQNLQLITRELINEMLTPEEEREWMTYTAHLPKHELEEAREHLVSAGVLTKVGFMQTERELVDDAGPMTWWTRPLRGAR